MKNFVKTYYPMVATVLFVFVLSFLMELSLSSETSSFDGIFALIFLVFEFLLVVAIWAMIIGFMIHASKNKELSHKFIWIFSIYFFNIFIIPIYNLKYVVKENNIFLNIVIFVLMNICSILIGIECVNKFII